MKIKVRPENPNSRFPRQDDKKEEKLYKYLERLDRKFLSQKKFRGLHGRRK